LKPRDTRVHVIRVPLEVSDEILKQAETTDHSFNHVINKVLKSHLEQVQPKQEKKEVEIS